MKLQYGMMIWAVAAMAVGSFADPVQISVTGTAQTTEMGYTAGQSYTFTWVVDDGYTGGSGDTFTSFQNFWNTETTTDPLLWASVSGDGLSGTYSRPGGSAAAPSNYIQSDSNGLTLVARNDDPSGSSMGLTVNGSEVSLVLAYRLAIPGLDYSDTAFVNPATRLADYAGTYPISSGLIDLRDESSNQIFFAQTSATIAAIPEPSTIAFLGLFGSGIFIVRHFFPSV